MAQRRTKRQDLPTPAERTAAPNKDDYNLWLDFLNSRQLVTVRVRRSFQAQAIRPGDSASEARDTEPLAVGAVVQLRIQPDAVQNQTAGQLAEMGCRGWFDIIDDAEFAAAAKEAA